MTAVLLDAKAVTPAEPDEDAFWNYVDRMYSPHPEMEDRANPLWITFDHPVLRFDRQGRPIMLPNGKQKTSRKAFHSRYDTNELMKAWEFVKAACVSDTRQIYMSLAPRKVQLDQYHRGTAAESAGLPCLFADLDFNAEGAKHKLGDLPTEAQTREIMAAWPGPQPTFECVTGGGVHLYWLTSWLVQHELSGNPDTAADEAADMALISSFAVGIKEHFASMGFHTDGSFGGNPATCLRPAGATNKYGGIVTQTEVTGRSHVRSDFDFLKALAERAQKRRGQAKPAAKSVATAAAKTRTYAEGTSSLEWAQSDHPSAAFCRAMPIEEMLINVWGMYEDAPDEWFMDEKDETGFVTYSSDAAAVKIWRNSDDGIPRAHAYSTRVQPLWLVDSHKPGFTAFDLLVLQCGNDRSLALKTAKEYIS